jgi:hypothetical protein
VNAADELGRLYAIEVTAREYVDALTRVRESDGAGYVPALCLASEMLHELAYVLALECPMCDPGTCPYGDSRLSPGIVDTPPL